MPEPDPGQRDDPVESGALADEPDVPGEGRPPTADETGEGSEGSEASY